MAQVIVKPWLKIVAVVLIVAGVVFGISKWAGSGNGSNPVSSLFGGGSSDDDVITIGISIYAEFMPFMYLNGGLDPNEESIIYKEYGLKLKIVIQDDFQAGRAAFRNGDIDVIYSTADVLPVEMREAGEMTDARLFNISNWSRGADAINVKVVGSGLDAAAILKAGQCDAAVVFSPDDQDIVASMNGEKVLISTKQASNIICDCLIAKQSYIDGNKEKLSKLLSALLYANQLMNTDEKAVAQATKAFVKHSLWETLGSRPSHSHDIPAIFIV